MLHVLLCRDLRRSEKKLAHALVNGKVLFIEGGEYRLCEGLETDVEEDVAEAAWKAFYRKQVGSMGGGSFYQWMLYPCF